MTATLYLNLNTYPLPYGSTAKVHADIWLASKFLNDPSGVSQPPQGATADGTTGTVTIAFGGTAATIAGLDNTKAYWLRVFSPQGYTHWFPVNWTTGNSSGSPLFVRVPAIEGPVTVGGPSGTGTLANQVTMSVTTRLSSAPFDWQYLAPAIGVESLVGPPTQWEGRGNLQFQCTGSTLGGASPYQVTMFSEGTTTPTDGGGNIQYEALMNFWDPVTNDYMTINGGTGDTIPIVGSQGILWDASVLNSSGTSFTYAGSSSRSQQPVSTSITTGLIVVTMRMLIKYQV